MGKVNGGLPLSPHPAPCPPLKKPWPALHAKSHWMLQSSLRKHHPLPSRLPSPPNATVSNSLPLPPTTLSLPDSDNYPAQSLPSSPPTSTHHTPSSPHAESNPPPHSPPDSTPLAPSIPFLEGTPTLLGLSPRSSPYYIPTMPLLIRYP